MKTVEAPAGMSGQAIVDLARHTDVVRMVGAVHGRPDSGGWGEGVLVLDAGGEAVPRFQQPTDVRQHRTRR